MRIDLPEREPVPLASREAFRANPNNLAGTPHPEGPSLFRHYLLSNCGGIGVDFDPDEIFAALNELPTDDLDAPNNMVIAWFLGSMKIWEAVRLVTLCGIPKYVLAEHLRAHRIQYNDVNIMLNQFAQR